MVILRSQDKITDFSMILAWASPFKFTYHAHVDLHVILQSHDNPVVHTIYTYIYIVLLIIQ